MTQPSSPRSIGPRSIADVLAETRSHITRVSPEQARAALQRGALLVDTRPQWQRDAHGAFPDEENVLLIERNHLEWRLDPTERRPHPAGRRPRRGDRRLLQEGYASSLAVKSLQDLGLHNVVDLDGGFLGWRDAGLPTA